MTLCKRGHPRDGVKTQKRLRVNGSIHVADVAYCKTCASAHQLAYYYRELKASGKWKAVRVVGRKDTNGGPVYKWVRR